MELDVCFRVCQDLLEFPKLFTYKHTPLKAARETEKYIFKSKQIKALEDHFDYRVRKIKWANLCIQVMDTTHCLEAVISSQYNLEKVGIVMETIKIFL